MAEEISYQDGDIVWVKMNKLWWPGEVHGSHRLPSDFFDQFKKPPLVIVKFFQEHNYHYVNQLHQIARFNCAKKNEFIKKGLDLYYAKHTYMEEFPADVAIAEKRTGGNPNIIYSKEFMPAKKPDKTIPVSASKGSSSRSRRGQQIQSNTPSIPRVMIKPDHDTRILVPSAPAASASLATTPTAGDNKYKCTACNYSTNRINTFVWHQKTHNSPKTPQVSATKKCPTEQTFTPSVSTINPDETKATGSVKMQSEDENNVSVEDETSKPQDEIAEPVDKKASEPVVCVEKSKGKRLRQTAKETRSKLAEKAPKTDNKLRKILDDWSDDEAGEAGPSGLTSNKNVNCIVLDTDDEEDVKQECSVKKKLKFDNDSTSDPNGTKSNDNDSTSDPNGTKSNDSDLVSDDLSPKILSLSQSTSFDEDITENKPKSEKKDETIIRESGRLQANDVTNDEAKLQTRFSLRSGRTMLTNENSALTPITTKRRGRAKRNANDSLKCEAVTEEIKESGIEPMLPDKTETIAVSSDDKVVEESVNTASVQAKGKSNSKTSRKGKPRRKEEIKLANNISVAVLVEKTNTTPTTDKGSEQKLVLPAEDNEYSNVVHKKIRYMSHSSTDDHRKSIESAEPMEEPKLPEPDQESNNHTDDRMVNEPGNHKENDDETPKQTVHSNEQNEENDVERNANDVLDVSMPEHINNVERNSNVVNDVSMPEHINLNTSTVANLDDTESTEKMNENSTVSVSLDEERVKQKCYKRKATSKTNSSLDQPDISTSSPIYLTDDTSVDTYESPSSSNLRQRAPKRYENTRNRRKSDRRTTSDDDFSSIVREIDDNCEKNDRARQKSVHLNNASNEDIPKLSEIEILDDSGKDGTDSTNLFDQSSENSNSKTSTPEKADNSKELDCFDFTEDECQPQVLNRRKRLPPVKVFELEDMDKIEDQRKIDEEAKRVAEQREEENRKLHAELENLLNSTTPVTLPEIPIGLKVHENFPERRAEKDPEKIMAKESDCKDRMLPPKERNKRIFKYRNRNRRPDSDATAASTSYDVEENKGNNSLQQTVLCDENIVSTSVDEMEVVTSVVEMEVVTSVDEMEVEQKLQSNEQVSETDKGNASAHDLKIEIAETLINFPLLSPQTDRNEQSLGKVVAKSPIKTKELVKRTKTIKKLRTAATVATVAKPTKILPDVNYQQETTLLPKESNELLINTTKDSFIHASHTNQQPAMNSTPNSDNSELHFTPNESNNKPLLQASITKTIETDAVTANTTIKPSASNSVRDFSRIRLIEKIDNHTPIQSTDEMASNHQLPLKKTVIITQTEGNSFISRIPKKRKSQMDDDIPAFVIERPKDHPDDATESNNQQTLTHKEPKSFIVTKTVKKQITGDLPKPNTLNVGGGVHQNPNEVNEGAERNANLTQQESKTNASTNTGQSVIPISSSITKVAQITGASEISSIESPVIVSSHLIIHKNSPATNVQKRSGNASTAANVLGSLSANRPCTIAPAKKASYRRPADMTGLTQKQIGIDGKGNPVMIYTKITPIVTQTPPVISQATFAVKRNEPIPSTSQSIQTFSPSLQSKQGNQFVITSKGALITNKPFITTTHSTQLHQPTLTHRPNIQVHTQIIRSPNPQVFQTQQQQHLSPQSSQILIQTKPTNLLSQVSSLAPVKKQAINRRSVVNKTKIAAPVQSNDRISNSSGYGQVVKDDNTTFQKRVVQRTPKNQSPATATQQIQSNQQHQAILNSEINHISNAATPVPPLIPLNDQSLSVSSRKQLKQQQPTQMPFVQEPQMQSKTTHVDVVEQHQEILALPGDTPGFGGPPGSYFLCKLNEMGVYIPIDRQPLYLDVTDNTNLLKPNAPEGVEEIQSIAMNEVEIPQQSPALFELNNENERVIVDQDANNPKYLINISDGQQLLVDQQSLMALANGEEFPQFVTSDGHQIILQSGQHDILSAIAFAEDVGLIAGQQILIPEDDLAVIQGQGGNHDILAAALAGTEAFSQEQFIDNVLIQSTNGVGDIVDPMVYHAMPQQTVAALTNETNAVLTQPPIMSTLEQPTKTDRISPNNSLHLMGQNLDARLAVIGVTSNTNVPTSLELPITITNPAIAPKTTSSMSTIYPSIVTSSEHDLDYDLFRSLPITHHLTQSLAINENYRTVNVINSIGDVDLDSNIVAVSTSNDHHQFIERN